MGYFLAAGIALLVAGWFTAILTNDPVKRLLGLPYKGAIIAGLMVLAGVVSTTIGAILFLIRL